MIPATLRAAAIAIALLGLIDPGFDASRVRPAPVRVEIVESPGLAASLREHAESIRARLVDRLKGAIDVSAAEEPAAVVLIGERPPDVLPAEEVPISTVSLRSIHASRARIVRVSEPPPAPLRQSIAIDVAIESDGRPDRTTVVTARVRGVLVDHEPFDSRDRQLTRLRYAPPSAGLHVVTIALEDAAGASSTDERVEVAVEADDRPLRVLAYEPRPSWNATFVRRALESDARFDVASLVRSSRGVLVRGGDAPGALTDQGFHAFDAVLVGAPEELRDSELAALSAFAGARGGAVVFLPDRKPGNSYAAWIPARLRLDEMLVENAVRLHTDAGVELRASELLVAARAGPGVVPVASIDRGGQRSPAGLLWTHGAGHVLLWGALDAWRFRADTGEGFATFWRSTVARLAHAAPAAATLSLSPRLAAPHERLAVRAAVRATEFRQEGGRTMLPAVSAAIVSADGDRQLVRMWPTAEIGKFEGYARVSEPGDYTVEFTAGGTRATAPLAVRPFVRRPADPDSGALALVAASTGGVSATGNDLAGLEAHLRALPSARETVTLHPFRSTWTAIAFAACLVAEWALRRRRGLA